MSSIEYRVEHVGEDLVEDSLVRELVELIADLVPDPTSVELVVTGCMAETVRKSQPDYVGQRILATVEGKVVTSPSGGLRVILPCWSLLKAAPDYPESRHTAAHEAFHVATTQRGEQLDGLRDRCAEDGQAWLLAAVAAQLVEEYRVERAALEVADRGEPERDSLEQKLEESLSFLREISTLQRRIADEQGSLKEALLVFVELTRVIAWIAAADLASDGDLEPDSSGPGWKRLIGAHYATLREALSRLPSASTPIDAQWLAEQALALIPILADWLRFIGVLTGVDNSGGPAVGWNRIDF